MSSSETAHVPMTVADAAAKQAAYEHHRRVWNETVGGDLRLIAKELAEKAEAQKGVAEE